MNSKQVYLVCLVVVIFAMTVSVNAGGGGGKKGGKGKGKWGNMTCKGEPLNMKDARQQGMDCIKELYPTATTPAPGTKPDWKAMKEMFKNTCVDVCKWKKMGVLNDDGTYNDAGTDTFVKATFPSAVQADMKKAMDACSTASSSKFSMDNNCAGYQDFKKCQWKAFADVCGLKGGKKGGGGGGGGDDSTDD